MIDLFHQMFIVFCQLIIDPKKPFLYLSIYSKIFHNFKKMRRRRINEEYKIKSH